MSLSSFSIKLNQQTKLRTSKNSVAIQSIQETRRTSFIQALLKVFARTACFFHNSRSLLIAKVNRNRPALHFERLESRALLTGFSLGDVVFTGYQATTTDKASIVLLKDISGTSILTVTDNAWSGTAMASNEGTSAITFSGAFSAGTQLNFDAGRMTGSRWAIGTTTTNISDVTSSNFALNASGDNLFAYDGTIAPATGTSVSWVSAFASNAFLSSGTSTASLTFLPSIFTSSNSAFSLGLTNGAANANGSYTGPNVTDTVDQVRTAISTLLNWTTFTAAGGQPVPPNATFTIQNASNAAPTALNLSNAALFENAAINAFVGTLTSVDPNSGNTFTYSLVSGPGSTDNASFNVNGNALQANSSFDYETKSTYTIRVRTTDQGGLLFEQSFAISVLDVNEVLNVRINEIKANPPGSTTLGDKFQFVELLGTPGASLSNVSFVMLDGNGATSGLANFVIDLGTRTLGSNGLLVLKSPTGGHSIPSGTTVVTDPRFDNVGGALSKLTVSFFLVTSTSQFVQGNDYDFNNDGNLDGLPAGFALLDNVGWSDGNAGDLVYGGVVLTQTQGTTDAATRIVNNTTLSKSAWYNGDLYDVGNDPAQTLYDQTRGSTNLPISPVVASITPGAFNFQQVFAATASLRVVSYNIASSESLPRTGIDTLLQAIGNEVVNGLSQKIDLLALQEIASQAITSANIAALLNTLYGSPIYAYGTLNGATIGAGTQGVVYNTQSLQLLSERVIGTAIVTGQPRQTVRGLFQTVAGGFQFYVYNGHWKSADDADGRDRRLIETQAIRADADALGNGTNILYVGDFNLYNSNESAYQNILSAGNGQAIDPANRPGAWHSSASFKDIFTQAPLVSPPGGLTGGGLDDRFDFQLVSNELTDGIGLDYIPNSYRTFGNNGSINVNGNLNDSSSTALLGLPNRLAVLDLLTTVSDHLPVVADYRYPVNLAPTNVSLSASTIAENAAANVVVGTFSSTDPNAGNIFTYTLVTGTGSADNAAFSISGSTLTAVASFDFETKSNYTLRVRTTDQGGLFFEKTFAITITNINEAPVAVNDTGATTELGTTTGAVLSNDTDPDTGETATLVVEMPGTITTVNGILILAANGTYSYTANANQLRLGQTVTDSFTYKAKDVNGALSNVATLVITITGENDVPTAVGFSLPSSVNEGSAGTVTVTGVTDVDLLDTFTYNYVLKKNGVAVQTSGFVSPSTFNLTPDDGAAGIAWTVEVQARDAAGAVSPVNSQALTVANVAPVLTRLNASLTGGVGTLFTNTGTYADVPADTVTLSADIGTIVNNGNGTWSWSHTPATAVTNQVITITGTDEDGGSSIVTFTLTARDITPPTIGSVKVAGSAWAVGFRDFLDPIDGDNTDGSDGTGFQIPTDTLANQLRPLSWTNVNTIVLAFSESVTGVNLSNIQVIGVNKLDYKVAGGIEPQLVGVTYNSTTNEATLSFNGSLTADKLLIRIGAGLVQDTAGNALAAYSFRLNVLPGDVTQNGVVANNDITLIRAQLGLAPGVGYDPRRDLNGNGVIANNDVTLARARLGAQLPPADPV